MLPVLFYGVIIPFIYYVLPVAVICFLFYKFYVHRLLAGSRKAFLVSWKGKLLIAFLSLLLVLTVYAIFVFFFKLH
jgi:hypothetical protein